MTGLMPAKCPYTGKAASRIWEKGFAACYLWISRLDEQYLTLAEELRISATPRMLAAGQRYVHAICGSDFPLDLAALYRVMVAASADTHPKDGDVKQAPLVSGAVGEAETPGKGRP